MPEKEIKKTLTLIGMKRFIFHCSGQRLQAE